MKLLIFLAAGATVLSLGACSLFGKQGVPIASYSLIRQEGAFELRDYPTLIVAKTTVRGDYDAMGDVAFRRLFKYISGDNVAQKKIAMTAPVLEKEVATSEKIAMTAPVLMREQEESWMMAFVLPASYSLTNAPQPTDTTVTLDSIAPQKRAVVTFSGFLNADKIAEQTTLLQGWLAQNKLTANGIPLVAGYDPPWTLPMWRRNEVQIPVQ